MFRRVVPAVAAVALLLAAATGCTGTPGPAETTADALTEDEAFAAAEETYRAYVDALNQVDLSDPETFEPVYALTTGEANAEAKKSFSQMHAEGWSVIGASRAALVQPDGYGDDVVSLSVCLDVSEVDVLDSAGISQVDPDRVDVQSMRVSFQFKQDRGSPVIQNIEGREGEPTCDGD